MSRPDVPFIRLNGRTYLNLAFTLPPAADVPPLPELLEQLLRHVAPADVLLLRALSRREEQLVKTVLCASEHESWALVVVSDDDRYRPRK